MATGSPCGPAACTGIPGGAGLVAVKYTRQPETVARVMEYLGSEAVAREFAARSLFLPANKAVQDGGVEYETRDPQVAAALEKLLGAQKTTSRRPSACRAGAGRRPTTARSSIASAR